jgi:hypothetical protein
MLACVTVQFAVAELADSAEVVVVPHEQEAEVA